MEIFEKILEELKRHQVENFKSWLYSLAKNYCLMRLRKEKSVRRKEEGYQKSAEALVENDEFEHLFSDHANGKMSEKLTHGLEQLKSEQRECIHLFYFLGKSYDEIAGQTGYSQKQVKSYLQNGKRNLKIYLTNSNE